MCSSLIAFRISAPGKVILNGEHSVVYGKPAIAGVIGLRNYLTLQETPEAIIKISFDKMAFQYEIGIIQFNKFHAKNLAKYQNPGSLNHEEYLGELRQFLCDNKTNVEDKQLLSLIAFFYLLSAILVESNVQQLSNGLHVVITTEMSIGAGIGSSASYGVCLAAAFYLYSRFSEFKKSEYQITDEMKNKISQWAFYSEKIMHGNPSGLDNTICTFGNIVKFYKGATPSTINLKVPFKILLVDTGVSRSTAKLVQNVAEIKKKYPKLMENILNSMGEVVESAVETFENLSDNVADRDSYANLKELFSINNNLLRSIGVSHKSLEHIFFLCENYGFGSKLTGAGGGGYAIVLVPPHRNDKDFTDLCADLTKNGYMWQETTVGGPGVVFEVL